MDGYAPKIALGLGLRHDWGPQYTAHQFQGELAWLGIRSTASYVGEPECNGVAERFMRTLKEECLYLHDFESLEEAPSLPTYVRHGARKEIRVGRRQRKRTCWDCEREWKRMVVPLEPGRPSEARQLLRTRR